MDQGSSPNHTSHIGQTDLSDTPQFTSLETNEHIRIPSDNESSLEETLKQLESLSTNSTLSRSMIKKVTSLISFGVEDAESRCRSVRMARSIGERALSEILIHHQDPHTLSTNLWAAVRSRGCQFLGPAMQEEVLKLVLNALENGSALSRKVLVMYVVQQLSPHFPHQASKTAIGHVIQLLYRASCFKLTKRDGDSSLMQLKEEFCSYESLRREHDSQIVSIALEAGLRISPDQWSSLLYGDSTHKSHMQSIIDTLQSPHSFHQSIQELVIALQRTGDPGHLSTLKPHLERLSVVDTSSSEGYDPSLEDTAECLSSAAIVTLRLVDFLSQFGNGNFRGGVGGHHSVTTCSSLRTHRTIHPTTGQLLITQPTHLPQPPQLAANLLPQATTNLPATPHALFHCQEGNFPHVVSHHPQPPPSQQGHHFSPHHHHSFPFQRVPFVTGTTIIRRQTPVTTTQVTKQTLL